MHLLKALLFLVSLALKIQAAALSCKASKPSCRCFPCDACWPSQQQWNEFNATLGGKLISTVPIGSVCHTNGEFGSYNQKACAELISNWGYPATHYGTCSSPMAMWFANFSCDPFLSPETGCNLGGLQRFAVNVSGVRDVQNTLQFVRDHNVRLVIRNTGHDYLGKSTAPGALALWMHHLKDIRHLEYTSPAYNGSAMRLGAGVQGFDAMAAAHAQGEVVVTGNCESVGIAGGYTQGGGHGQLASRFGMAADQALEWEVVTATGEHLVASPTQNADLFWALTGGGGGTYAIVLSVTVKTHPEMTTTSATLTFDGTGRPAQFWDVVQTFVKDSLPLVDAGAVAIWAVMGSLFSLAPIALPGGNRSQLQDGLVSTLTQIRDYNMSYKYTLQEFPTFWDSYGAMNPHSNITEAQIGGRLMPRSAVESNLSTLITTLRTIAEQGAVVSGVSLNVSRSAVPVNSVNPAWRDAAISFVLGTTYNYTNRSADIQGQSLMTDDLIPRLTALSPGSGSYLNEADWNQPDWKWAFYGDNYAMLESIKNKYDPDQILYARTAVGSDQWVQRNDGCLCRP